MRKNRWTKNEIRIFGVDLILAHEEKPSDELPIEDLMEEDLQVMKPKNPLLRFLLLSLSPAMARMDAPSDNLRRDLSGHALR